MALPNQRDNVRGMCEGLKTEQVAKKRGHRVGAGEAAENQRGGRSYCLVEETPRKAGGEPRDAELWKVSRGKSSMAGCVPGGWPAA